MSNQKEFSCLEKSCKVYSKTVDIEGEYQESLPAYLDDIYRVVKCVSNTYVTSADISFNEVKIYGKCLIQVTYYNENSVLCYSDFEEDFSKTFTVDNLSDTAFVRATICDKYTNFRVINQRRIDIHTMSVLNIIVYDSVKYPCLQSCENSRLKTEDIFVSNVIANYVDKIDFDEDVSLPADSKAVGRIVSSSYYATITDTKIIKDKVLIKANLTVTILYSADTDEAELEKATYSFPLSKIIDRSGIEEGDILIANVTVGSIFFKVKGTANEKISVINIYGDLALNLMFIRENKMSVITDGYTLGNISECKYLQMNADADGKYIADSRLVNIPLEFNSELNSVEELSVNLATPNYRDGKIISSVNAVAISQADGGLSSLNASSDFEIPFERFDDAALSVEIESYDYTIADSGRIDLRLNLNISGYCTNNADISILEDIDITDKEQENHTLTVYFGKENEKVWDIAKSFLADENDIIAENSLNGDTLDTSRVLIIPKA